MGVGKSKQFAVGLAIFVVFCFSLMMGVVAHAQVTGATLTGTVTDPSGAVVAGAQVSAKNSATGDTRQVTTDSAGLYNMPNLTPGAYDIKVSSTGFATSAQSGITLAVGQTQQLNFALKVGDTTTTVQVTEAAPQIDLTSSALSGQVESETVRELPLNGRDWTSLAQLQPGVKPIETQMSYSTSARGNRGFGGEMTVSGQRSTFNNYRIDGISVNDYAMAAPGNVIGVVLGVDAIQEFSVLTGGFPAEYGRATGGIVNAISRSGTNQFHGAVYEFLRNSAFDANDYFTRSAGSPIPPFRRNQFGASAGAPIIKDKLFVFADYEGLRQSKGVPTVAGVLSNNARLGDITSSNFVGAGAASYNLPNSLGFAAGTPCNTLSGTNGTYLSPLANLCVDNYSAQLLGLFPTSSLVKASNADLATFVFAGVQSVPENFGTIRADYRIGNSDSIFGTFLKDNATYNQPDAYNDVLSQSTTARTTIAIEENHTFGSSFVNAARVGYNRDNVRNQFTPTAINPLAGNTALGAITGQAAPRLSVHGGVTDFFGGTNGGSHYLHTWNSYQYYDDAIWTKGAHTIKIGGGVERMLYNQHTFQEPAGRYQFNDYVGFLSGIAKSWEAGLLNVTDNPREFRQTTFSLYAQDDWKIKSNLTINLGLRYEPTTVLKDAQGRITNLATISATAPTCGTQFTAPGPALPGSSCGGVGPYYKNPTLRNFEPRVGFAWDPFKDGKTSVRGSFGIYDVDPFAGYFLLQQNQAGPFLVFKSIKGAANWKNQDPANPVWGAGDGGTQLTNFVGSKLAESTIEGTPHRNYVEEYNLTLQRQLTSDLSLTVGYVGSHGVHLMMRGDDGNMTGAPGTPTPEVTTQYGYLFPGGGAQVNPTMGVIRYIYWNTTSNYNALNVNLDKKFAHGFQLQAAYTYSKSLDDDSQTIAGDTFANGINSPWWWLPKAFYGPSDFNVTHTLSVNALYTLPTPKDWNGFRKEALADWEIGGIFTYNSGTPTTAINNGDPLNLGNSGADQFGPLVKLAGCNPVNKNWIGGPAPVYINESCYSEPSLPTSAVASLPYPCVPFAAGSPFANVPGSATSYCANLSPFNVGRNQLYGPNFVNMDFSVHKVFPITKISEQFNVQFRAEIFNIFNHSNFVPPQPCSGDCNSGLLNPDGTSAGVGNLAELAGLPREVQFALKVQW
ncbi:MAG TPA: TonB-dependent receptor [Bryobacteraceae bacterium]|nr:TonB-dependent receptor [Bryobacteraceae bacterium]